MQNVRHDAKTPTWRSILAGLVAISLVGTSACTSLRTVPLSGSPTQPPAVAIGDRVIVTLKDGEQQDFQVTSIESDALLGVQTRVRYQDIAALEIEEIDKGKTAGLIGLIVGAVVLIAAQVVKGYSDLWNTTP